MKIMKKKLPVLLFAALLLGACSRYSDYNGGYKNEAALMPEGAPFSEEAGAPDPARGENPFIEAAVTPVSTFSVDADGASYAYARRSIQMGFFPSSGIIRLEEFLNYFTFDYPDPVSPETLAINAEMGACPWTPEHRLLRLGLKGKSLSANEIPDANYILLIDVSGSMTGDDRIELLKSGLLNMLEYMRPDDRIAIITYSGKVSKLLESTLLSEGKDDIRKALSSLKASGSTAGGEAMKMAYEEASAHYIKGGNNRIIMCTDGDFNVGVSSTEELTKMVESYQDKGIYLSIMGFGMGNYQDARMEQLSNVGNGTYTYIDSEEEMMKVFVEERSHLVSVANDTKCQVRFNPEVVASYRLLGYENRLLSEEDFENDKKDAGEIGAGQTVTALYELVMVDDAAEEASPASFDVRYKLALGEESRALNLEVPGTLSESENIRFASAVAAFGLCLNNSEYKGDASFSLALELLSDARSFDPGSHRANLEELITRCIALAK